MIDIAVIGAGVAGLTCAQKLHRSGYEVVVIDKSQGLGGRLATRRLGGSHADHGVCYLKPKGELFRQWIDDWVKQSILQVWTEEIYTIDAAGNLIPPAQREACYAASTGATTIAKIMAAGLTVRSGQLVIALKPIDGGWKLRSADGVVLQARRVVVTMPPAQALDLVGASIDDPLCMAQLQSVQFLPSLVAIATYGAALQPLADRLDWRGIKAVEHPTLGWIGLDSSKQVQPTQPVMVVQSSVAFAQAHFEGLDLMAVGQQLINAAAGLAPWIAQPEVLQVHRWRYAFAQNPLATRFLAATTGSPLYFGGDWCGGLEGDRNVEAAYLSGLAIADELMVTIGH
jgi:renalase